jgi:flagellar hook-length control protein FliK
LSGGLQNSGSHNDASQKSAPDSAAPQTTATSIAAGQAPALNALFTVPPQAPIAASTPSTPASPATVTPATVADLASQTAAQIGQGASQFQITLTPEGLGQVSVTVSVGAEGKVSAAFALEKPETADALSGRSSDLQKALEQAGFSLSDSGLTFALATPIGHGQGANANQNPGGASGQSAGQGGAQQGSSQGGSSQGGSGQGGSSQGGSGQDSTPAFAQAANSGSGQGDGGRQGQSWTYGQTGALAFATASDAAAAVDQSPYASRSASGLDIRI